MFVAKDKYLDYFATDLLNMTQLALMGNIDSLCSLLTDNFRMIYEQDSTLFLLNIYVSNPFTRITLKGSFYDAGQTIIEFPELEYID